MTQPQVETSRTAERERADVGLCAVLLGVKDDQPEVLALEDAHGGLAIAHGAIDDIDTTLERALRRMVERTVGAHLAYVEQLYTFGDRGRDPQRRALTIAYLALVRREIAPARHRSQWLPCYQLFPWEDFRAGRPEQIDRLIVPALRSWAKDDPRRGLRADITFGLSGSAWDPHRVLERYELLYEVGLVDEARRDAQQRGNQLPSASEIALGRPMALDHRRIVATALGRVRGKLSYRPVVFEMLPSEFTLSQLQRLVEALAGFTLHTPNFRRLVSAAGLVEPTGHHRPTGGRPAELFRFRGDVLRERPTPGVGLPGAR
ncbi:MAG: NAD regulator [Deltaproteobacteria bacterium]|nr:NAD regulator [Deltaproteobacteria bacterium]